MVTKKRKDGKWKNKNVISNRLSNVYEYNNDIERKKKIH